MTTSIRRPATSAIAAICLALAACGGGGSDNDSTLPVTEAVPSYTPDLRSFAIAWTSLQIAETAFDALLISGNTGDCGVGGSTRYDLGTLRQTLAQCVTKVSPDASYTGAWSAMTTTGANQKTVTVSSPALVVADPGEPAEPTLAITAGNVSGTDDFSNDTLDAFSGVGFSLDARIGASTAVYHVGSSAGATASVSVQNGTATLLVSSASVGVNYAGGAWKFSVQGLRSVGDFRPDQGTMVIADQSQPSTANLKVTFGTGNSLQFASGGQTVTKSWNDADVQAALAVAKQ